MPRGDKPIKLLKPIQIKRYVNEQGLQVTKDAVYELGKFIERDLKLIIDTTKAFDITRLKLEHIHKAMEKLYGNKS
tara:strand:- start:108 stop:335 length:228 start_codon:yes stop_codon:yes gene_type:complete